MRVSRVFYNKLTYWVTPDRYTPRPLITRGSCATLDVVGEHTVAVATPRSGREGGEGGVREGVVDGRGQWCVKCDRGN